METGSGKAFDRLLLSTFTKKACFLSRVPAPLYSSFFSAFFPCPSSMGASASTSRNGISSESVPPTPQPQEKLKAAKSSTLDDYQVFLSFRGPDTRNGFTDVLYDHMANRAGIRVFKDEDEIPLGQPIDEVLQAIENSEICVPILSESFASSAWCLREVEKMVQLEKMMIPIFYKISPDDVKLKNDHPFNKAMKVHEEKHGKDQVEKWKSALKKIAELKGMEFSADRRYTEFCREIVNEILSKLKPRKRLHSGYLVGMDSQIGSMMELVDIASPGIWCIGIHGMQGIGKSTLAKALFAKLSSSFDCSCFLKDVRESLSSSHGLPDLQKQLLARLDPELTRGCISFVDIEERFQKKKVLIVLDDVDKAMQIEQLVGQSTWFGSGSRIIVTTTHIDILKRYGKSNQIEVRFFEMNTLKHDQALKLFQWHAFGEEKPPTILETISREIVQTVPNWFGLGSRILLTTRDKKVVEDYIDESGYEIRQFEMKGLEEGWGLELFCKCAFGTDSPPFQFQELSKRVVSYSGGLPLTITVTGKSLRNQESIQYWEEFIEGLQKSLPKEVKDKLMISYESLEDKQKTIFLDIACLCINEYNRFERMDIANLVLMWQASSLLPRMSLQVLQSRSFLKIDEDGNILMHDQLRDMGRSLVIKDSNGDSTQQSRLWENNDILRVLQCKEKKKRIEAIHLREGEHNMDYELLGFDNLRFLRLPNGRRQKISGILPKLVWLYLDGAYDVENLVLPNLVILQNMRNNFQDKITPSFIQNTRNLKILNMERCSKLSSIDPSIAELQHLTSLSLAGCSALRELPEELECLQNLIDLDLFYCGLTSLPESFGNLQSLVKLSLSFTEALTSLPESFGNLQSLVHLNLSSIAALTSLPESFGNLQSLVHLNLSSTAALTSLPESFGNLQSLVELKLVSTGLTSLPELFGKLQSLVNLQLYSTGLTSLPESFENLRSLVHLNLLYTKIRELPKLLESLTKLIIRFPELIVGDDGYDEDDSVYDEDDSED